MDATITVTGNLGTDVEYHQGDGFSKANFRMASTPRLRRGQEWVDGYTTWLNVECSNRIADNVRDSLAKGDPVVVCGRLRTRVWEAQGTKHERMVIEAHSIGHDLSRGTTQFLRNPVRSDAEADEEVAEVQLAGQPA
ncbi:MAG: single-stranded DNA-binding protein [Brooklawnia sp.]|uniref:single-stranded DNA-binding protein n=1 Tax=Brooklawnia sp. TaxID=2699740 RepID=UPI003C745A8E